jgi:hypothetical protein
MSDNELTISDYYEEYPIMRYILPGLVYNNGAAPQKNISNNAFILRQGAWILSKILDDEYTEYGYETFHPAQRYVIGDVSNAVGVDPNKLNTMMTKLNSITLTLQGTGAELAVGGVGGMDHATLANAYAGAGVARRDASLIVNCGINTGNVDGQRILRYTDRCCDVIDNLFISDNNLYNQIRNRIRSLTDVLAGNYLFPTLNVNPGGGGGGFSVPQNQAIMNGMYTTANFNDYIKILKTTLPNPYDIPFYIIKSLIECIIDTIGVMVAAHGNYDGNTLVYIIESCILNHRFINHLANLAITGFDTNINFRKNVYFNYLTAAAPNLNTAIGLHVPLGNPAGSFIIPYTDYEERSESTGGNTIDNRDLIDGIRAGAEPRLTQVGDRIRNGKKGDHIATVLTTDDVRLLAIFLQLALENFNAPAAKTLYNSRNDVDYKDYESGIRNPRNIQSYFDHLVALRESKDDVRIGSGLNQGKVEALSILAGLRYAIQGPIFPVLSQTVFHLVAHYFVRLVMHDSRAPGGGGAVDMNFHNLSLTDANPQFLRFLNGNGKRLQLLQTLDDQITITGPRPITFGCPGAFHGILPADAAERQPLIPPVGPAAYKHDTQVIRFIQLIQNLRGPGTVTPNTVSTAFDRTGNRGQLNAAAVGVPDDESILVIVKKVYDDIRTFVTGSQFNYTLLENNSATGGFETVFNGFAGTLAFHGHQELSNINLSTIEPTLFDADIRHLLKFNVTDKAIKLLGNEIHIIGPSTQNSFTGALVGPTRRLSSGGQFIVNDYGMLEYQEIINGQVVQTDNSKLYNKMIGNNDYCKVFGSARFGDPARNKGDVCNTMISACSIIGNYGNPTKCAAAFRDIQDNHVSKNLRGWNSLFKELTQLNAYKILTGMGFESVKNKDDDLTFRDDNSNYIYDDQQIYDTLELSKGVAGAAPGAPPFVPNVSTSNHVKYIKKLMDTVGTIKVTKNPQQKNKDDIPTLEISLYPYLAQRVNVNPIHLGMHGFQRGGDKQDNPINIMYGGNTCDLNIMRKNIKQMKEDGKKKGIVLKRKDEQKLDQIMDNLEKYHNELTDIDIYYKASLALKNNGRNPLKSELENKIIELKDRINDGYTRIEKAKQVMRNAYLVSIMN